MTRLWTTPLPASLVGSMRPVFDPLTNSLYVSDGWGTPFASLSLRRISVIDGSLAGAVRLRAPVFSVALGRQGEHALVASGKRLVELRRSDLEETARWEHAIPRYSHHSARAGNRALLMNWGGPSLAIFNLDEKVCTRRKAGSCQGLFPRTDGTVLVASGEQGLVCSCDPQSSVITELARPGHFIHAAFSDASSLLVLGLGDPFTLPDSSVAHWRLAERIAMVRLHGTASTVIVNAPQAFDALWLSEDGGQLFLGQGSTIQHCTLEGSNLSVVAEHRLPDPFEPFLVILERGILLCADLKSAQGTVAAWRI